MTVVELRGTVRVCASCDAEFEDRSRTSPRSYCYECSPIGAKKPQPEPKRRPIRGVPFTIEHFRSWAGTLELPSGDRFELEEWEARFVADVFDGLRAGWLKEAWLIVPEGNGKSTLVAILILYCLEFEPNAAIPVAAAARDQAEIIMNQARGFLRRTASLKGRFQTSRREVYAKDGPYARIFAANAETGDGIIPFPLEAIDELHRHGTLELYRTWAGKLDKENAVLVVISTAGEPGSEFEDTREAMRQSATTAEVDGCFGRFVGATSVLHEYAVPEGGDVDDLELVKAANPSSRITVETLAAKRARPSYARPHWSRLTCNMPTRSVAVAITEREWYAAKVEDGIPPGKPVWLGLDLGWKLDTTAMVPLWIRDAEFRLFGPATILEPPRDGSQLDAHLVEAALRAVHALNPIELVVMDMSEGAQLSQWIQEELGADVVDRTQSIPMQAMDYKRFMEALRMGWLKHTGEPGLTQHALNATARVLPGGDVTFARPKESRTVSTLEQRRRVIDALVAAAMVHTSAAAGLDVEEVQPAWGYA